MEIISRLIAKRRGRKTYFTGKPCRQGHVAPRYVGSHSCSGCLRQQNEKRSKGSEKQKDYWRNWRWRHKGYPTPTRPRPAVCECCGGKPNGKGTLHLDHCHVAGKFRGWLCYKCNRGIGLLGDNLVGIVRALDYLARNS